MPQFLKLSSPVDALKIFLEGIPKTARKTELIDTFHSLNRVLGADLTAPFPLPEFPRSSMDGYAVMARDTFGVSESLPGYLTWIGEVPMGAIPGFTI